VTTDATLNATWLAARHGVDPLLIERRRRAGEMLATRDETSGEWRYPMWQFDAEGRLRAPVERVLQVAKENGIPPDRLEQLLERRVGLVGGTTIRELLLAGDAEQALAEVRGAA
jgi:hypothetical protein